MNKLLFPLLLLLTGIVWQSAQAQQSRPDTASSNRMVFTVTEKPPQFPGGMNQLGEYMRKNMRYPEAARQAGREGKVFVTFIVTDQGRIEQARVLRNVDPQLDAEAVRLIESMPVWTPAKQNGNSVNCRFNLPVDFRLSGSR
ncbi:energy transducer TonB [Larkinella insperata]|uniref:Energy transducer TonB n=1 Tax=Larkinella insperata TaxID=332158 RepID=A0ABW3QGJ3_9BACT|nr:energy transducer TonB [Larkinella insperata]